MLHEDATFPYAQEFIDPRSGNNTVQQNDNTKLVMNARLPLSGMQHIPQIKGSTKHSNSLTNQQITTPTSTQPVNRFELQPEETFEQRLERIKR